MQCKHTQDILMIDFFLFLANVHCFKVCEEKLQYSLSENVQTNVLWGSTVTESVVLHPWAETSISTASDAANIQMSRGTERFVMFWFKSANVYVLPWKYNFPLQVSVKTCHVVFF